VHRNANPPLLCGPSRGKWWWSRQPLGLDIACRTDYASHACRMKSNGTGMHERPASRGAIRGRRFENSVVPQYVPVPGLPAVYRPLFGPPWRYVLILTKNYSASLTAPHELITSRGISPSVGRSRLGSRRPAATRHFVSCLTWSVTQGRREKIDLR
jgi:hypothetical protein